MWFALAILGFSISLVFQNSLHFFDKEERRFITCEPGKTSYWNAVCWQINKRQITQQCEVRYTFSGPLLQNSCCFPFHGFFSSVAHLHCCCFLCFEYSSPLFGQRNRNKSRSVLLLIFISREIDQNARKILRSSNPIVRFSVVTLFSSNFTSVCFHDTQDLWCFIAIRYFRFWFFVCFLCSNIVKNTFKKTVMTWYNRPGHYKWE